MEQEIWKTIPDSKGYEVSNHGRVKRIERKVWNKINNSYSIFKERILTPTNCNTKKYWRIAIKYNNEKIIIESVHRLVALVFVENPNVNDYNQVNHIDGNRDNNYYKNLEWCNQSMNMIHRLLVLKQKPKNIGSNCNFTKLTEFQVLQIPKLLKTHSLKEIGEMFNVGTATICEIKAGRSWGHLNLFPMTKKKSAKTEYWK